jgi:hypothetical protein
MSTYFAFVASNDLRDQSLSLLEKFQNRDPAPLNKPFIQLAQIFVDEVMDALLLNIVKGAEENHPSAKMLEQLASIVKSTVHGLIKQILGKMSNEEMQPLASYITDTRLTINHQGQVTDYVTFELPEDFFNRYQTVLQAGSEGQSINAELLACVEIFSELSHKAFYQEPVDRVKLGFVGRKLADVGGAALRKGSKSTIRSAIPKLHGVDLERVSAYLLTLLLRADDADIIRHH